MKEAAFQQCINPACNSTFAVEDVRLSCGKCGSLLDIKYDWSKLPVPKNLNFFEHRWSTKGTGTEGRLDFSGVWRFRELLPFYRTEDDVVTVGEGRTVLQSADLLAGRLGMRPGKLLLQYEGLNPRGSFKDNGMTAAFTHARMIGARRVACASTGNTSASLALFAAFAEMQGIVFIGSGKIAFGKLSQALDYGALTLQINGDFDACLRRIRQIAVDVPKLGIYLMNSVNPFRLEGQKSIMFRILEALDWQSPDWVIVPGGNLGNTAAFGKALREAHALGLIDRVPRLLAVQAAGAAPFAAGFGDDFATRRRVRAETAATAIRIGDPASWDRAVEAIRFTKGHVVAVSDAEIFAAKRVIDGCGVGCEPASAASVAGVRTLVERGIIGRDERVVSVLTGHLLKDPDAALAARVAGGLGSEEPLTRDEALGHLERVLSSSSR